MSNATLQTLLYPCMIGLGFCCLIKGLSLKLILNIYYHMFKFKFKHVILM
jgi:hypothetical protein